MTTTADTPSTTDDADWPAWATSSVVEVDPVSLSTVGPAIPAGVWSGGSVVTDSVVAIATWPAEAAEQANGRWRLVVASRETGELLFDGRVGDSNVLGMFAAPSGEVMVVETRASAATPNFPDGFVIHGYNPAEAVLREAARFDQGNLRPFSYTLLSDGRLGIVGFERSNDAGFDHYRIVVFDWVTTETVMDVELDHLPLEADAPEGVFVDLMHHAVVWDEARGRVLVVHAHEDVITAVTIPSGESERVPLVEGQSLLGAVVAWFVPTAQAKGLPSSQRQAVIAGEHLYVVGTAVAFEEKTEGSHAYRHTATDLLKIDLDTLRIEGREQPGATVIASSPSGGYLLGGGLITSGEVSEEMTTETVEYIGLLVIDPDTLEVVAHHDEGNISTPYEVQSAPTGEVIYVPGPEGTILTFDPESGSINTTEKRGLEPALLTNSLSYESVHN